ncbi:MAG: hypothetical protein WA463_10165 [Terriglobales bacterium]
MVGQHDKLPQILLGLFPRCYVFQENKNSFRQSVIVAAPRHELAPRKSDPTVGAIPTVLFDSHRFSSKRAAVHLLPALRNVGSDFVMRPAQHVLTIERIVRAPAVAHQQIPHVPVNHRNPDRRVLYEAIQQISLRLQQGRPVLQRVVHLAKTKNGSCRER